MIWSLDGLGFFFLNPMKKLLKQSSSQYLSSLISTMEAFLLLVK